MQPGVPIELLESVVDLLEDGVVISLPDGRVVYHNQIILDMFGLSKDSIPKMLSDIGEVKLEQAHESCCIRCREPVRDSGCQ